MSESPPHHNDADIDRLASAAFDCDRRGGHHKGGPWTWQTIPEEGRDNYRTLVRAVLAVVRKIDAERIADLAVVRLGSQLSIGYVDYVALDNVRKALGIKP